MHCLNDQILPGGNSIIVLILNRFFIYYGRIIFLEMTLFTINHRQ